MLFAARAAREKSGKRTDSIIPQYLVREQLRSSLKILGKNIPPLIAASREFILRENRTHHGPLSRMYMPNIS